MKFLLTVLQWIFSLFAGSVILAGLINGQIWVALVALLAFVVVFPPIQRKLETKLAFLKPKVLKLLAGFILTIVALMMTPASAKAQLCQAPVAGKCAQHESELNVDQAESAYVVARLPNASAGQEATLELTYVGSEGNAEAADTEAANPDDDTPPADDPVAADGEAIDPEAAEAAAPDTSASAVVYTATQGLADGQAQFELPLASLPIGAYSIGIVAGDDDVTGAFELIGNPPRLNSVAVCSALAHDTCASSDGHYLEDSVETIYVTGAPQHIRSEIPVTVGISYVSVPGSSSVLNTVSTTLSPGATGFKAEVPLPALAVGSYEVSLSSTAQDFLTQTDTFAVWPSSDTLASAASGTLSSDTTQLSSLKVCEKTLTPEEYEAIISEQGPDELEAKQSDRCGEAQSSFAVGTQTVNADVEIGSRFTRPEGNLPLTFIWRYSPEQSTPFVEIASGTVDVTPDTGTYLYTLTAGEAGYEAGNYDLIVFLGTNSARPLRYSFTVE